MLGECNLIRQRKCVTHIIRLEVVSVNQWYPVSPASSLGSFQA